MTKIIDGMVNQDVNHDIQAGIAEKMQAEAKVKMQHKEFEKQANNFAILASIKINGEGTSKQILVGADEIKQYIYSDTNFQNIQSRMAILEKFVHADLDVKPKVLIAKTRDLLREMGKRMQTETIE